ncbi:FeoB-associated Cys-rich membrane protein [Selenomonadales bacterium OttesenSCG-928-I06]|nr:FeoB-associated Cys-rich membrane protein [Selenomonadales bacterium OttesenSCG-928-I06]
MNMELIAVGAIVLCAVGYLIRKFIGTMKSGGCSCDDGQGNCSGSNEAKRENSCGCSGCQMNKKD